MKTQIQYLVVCLTLVALAGCGGGSEPAAEVASQTAAGKPAAKTPPTASIPAQPAAPQKPLSGLEFDEEPEAETDPLEGEDEIELGEPIEGSPEWGLKEIARLRVEPYPETEDVEELRKARKARNDRIVELAAGVVRQTHQRAEDERLFNVAVHYMLEARLQSALQGDRESIDALYDDAASLWERDRNSKAAADAAITLVNLAYANAKSTLPKDTKWLKEFVRQASHFAVNFPNEEGRSVPLLFTAAYSCELNGLTEDAISAYSLIQKKFPQSRHAERVTGILRRLKLTGQPLQLGGPTLGGGYTSIDQFAGKVTLIVFWTAGARATQEATPILKDLEAKYGKHGLSILGICLETEEAAAQAFIKQHELTWPQILHTEEGKQGWNNPVATYYGVVEVGIWLVDQEGRVVSTSVPTADLEKQILPLLKRGASRKPSSPQR